MTEKARTIFLGILKLIPFAVVTAIIVLFWVDDFLGFMLAIFCFWIILPAIVLSIVFFVMGLRWRDIWQRIAVVWGGVNLLMLILYFLVQVPNQRCNPDIMAKHYEEHHTEMEELHRYLHSALKDSCVVKLEFDTNSLKRFYVGNRYGSSDYWDEEALAHQDSMMFVVGLTQEEFVGIQQRLKSMECIGIVYDQYYPDKITIHFCRDNFGCFSYILQNYPMTADERDRSMNNPLFIPYNEYCDFVYDGSAGAFDTGGFGEIEKRSFLKKHKPW